MKLPTPIPNDIFFHKYMALRYSKAGLQHFANLHLNRAQELELMREKIDLSKMR